MHAGVISGDRDAYGALAKAGAALLAAFLLIDMLAVGHAKADTASGIDYRELRTTAGALNTGTTVTVASFLGGGAGDYVVDPLTSDSSLKSTPNSATTIGYGWKTAGFMGQSIPEGTWSFTVETSSTLISSGNAVVRVYAYATDILGSNVEPIGTATGTTNRLNALGIPVSETFSFSASAIDMTDKVLVVEYWVIVTQAPLLEATVTLRTGSSVTSVTVPTSSPTTFYLSPAHMIAFGDSFSVSDSTARMLHAQRSHTESLATSDSTSFRVTRSLSETMAAAEQIRTRVSRSIEESVGVTDDPETTFIPQVTSTITTGDSVARTYFASRSAADGITITDSISMSVTRSITETLGGSDELSGKVTRRAISDTIGASDGISTNIAPRVADTITATDSIVRATSHSLADSLAVADSITARVTLRALSDSVGILEGVSPTAVLPASESIAVTDAVTMSITRSLQESIATSDAPQRAYSASRGVSETATLTDAASKSEHRQVSDSITPADSAQRTFLAARTAADGAVITDTVSKLVTRQALDTVALADNIVVSIPRPATDSLSINDSIAMSVTRSVSDMLLIGDSTVTSLSGQRAASDNLAIADITVRTHSASSQTADSIVVSDSLTTARAFSRQISETIALTDQHAQALVATRAVSDSISVAENTARTLSLPMSLPENIAVADSIAAANLHSRSVVDSVFVAENINRIHSASVQLADIATVADSLVPQPGISDQLAVADSVSIAFPRDVSDSITTQDSLTRTPGSLAIDSVQVADQITSVIVSWNRGFDESLAIGDCTPFSCNQALHLGEGIALADEFSPPPGFEEALAISDSITITLPRGTGDTLDIASSAGIIVRPLPASPPSGSPLSTLGALVVSDAALVDPLPAEPVTSEYSMPGGDPDALVDELGLPILELSGVSDLSSAAVVLPTYHVTLNPSDELPGDDALLTVRVAEIPAETQVIVPVDIASTPAAAEHGNIPSMTLDFTPAVDASDFALVVSMIDSPPAGAQEPRSDLVPLYLDIRWIGTFGGGVDPGTEGFYSAPPELTFAVTEEWAGENGVERDENGVPVISLNLLDESTGEWQEIDDVDAPTGADEDGRYVYVAHLKHFSTYALGASVDSGGSGGSSASGARLSVQLVDSLALDEERAGVLVEEGSASSFAVRLLDSVSIGSKPVAYWPLETGEDVSVLVTVADIKPSSLFSLAAKILVQVDIANTGTDAEKFVLKIWHDNRESGSSTVMDIGPGESRQFVAEVPFASHGPQVLNAETRTAEGDLIAFRQMNVDIPWVAVYLHLVVALLGGLAAAAGTALYMFLRQKLM